MTGAERLARRVFGAAGIYGLIVLTPFFFAESVIARSAPSGLTHPVYFYGFLGGAWVMQWVYLLVARDPVRFRPLMPVSALAKLSWFIPVIWLWSKGRTDDVTLAFATIDLLIGAAFVLAWLRLRKSA